MTREELAARIQKLSDRLFDEWRELYKRAEATEYATEGWWPEKERVEDALDELSYAQEHLSDAINTLTISDEGDN